MKFKTHTHYYETLLTKKRSKDLKKWKDIPYAWIRRLILLWWQCFPGCLHSQEIAIKIPTTFYFLFPEIDILILKYTWTCKDMQNSKTVWKKKKKWVLTISHLKAYNKAIVIKIMLSWHKDWQLDQGNGIENPEINLIFMVDWFRKGCQDNSGGNNSLFRKWSWNK